MNEGAAVYKPRPFVCAGFSEVIEMGEPAPYISGLLHALRGLPPGLLLKGDNMSRRARRSCRVAIAQLALGLWTALAGAQAPSDKAAPPPADANIVADQIVGPGYRRVLVDQRQPISQEQLAERAAAGKPTETDPATGDMIVRTFVDHLPANWMRERPAELAGARVDSFGNPIVNDTPGLPAWAQRDVEALRAAVLHWRDELASLRGAGADTREVEGILGNFIGQALTRAVDITDLVSLDDGVVVSDGVAASILNYLHYYENIRSANQGLFHYRYTPTQYPPGVAAFASRHGRTLAGVQALDAAEFGSRGFSCYQRTVITRGMTNLSGQTDLWVANGLDDSSADIPTGFPIFWYMPCQSSTNNDSVRVSTNGYLTFFQQGGGALLGTRFSNDSIPQAADPDGFVAPWWDDLVIATGQGTPDRVSYKTEGALDQRVFTVEWFSVTRLFGTDQDWHFFQAKLYETSGAIDLQISNDWNADTADNATVGIEDLDGGSGVCGPNCDNTNTAQPPSDYRFIPVRPFNDTCSDPDPLASGASRLGEDLRSADADGDASCGLSSHNRDLWYSYTALCDGTLSVSACGSRDAFGAGTGVDTVVSIHSACPGNATNQIACNDDGGVAGCSSLDSLVTAHLTAGQTVLIRVSHYGDEAHRLGNGRFNLAVNYTPASPVSNDQCANALPMRPGDDLEGSLACASNDGSATCGNSEMNADVWYTFTAPLAGSLTAHLCGSRDFAGEFDAGIDGVLSIHSGCPGTVDNEIDCNDDGHMDGCNSLDSFLSVSLDAGQQVYIRVSHYGDDSARIGNGRFALHTDFSPLTATCGSADFNCDGDTGTDADIEAFFRCLAGTCPPAPCESTADFNLDGDAGTDADIEAFFRVLAGGAC
jgi:hypothetical protein